MDGHSLQNPNGKLKYVMQIRKPVEVDVNAEVVVDKKLAKRQKLKEKQNGTRLY
jgi:hypothetical protein